MVVAERLIVACVLLLGIACARSAAADRSDCSSDPGVIFTLVDDPDGEESQLEGLAEIARGKRSICIRAYYEDEGELSKLFAFRRTNWIKERLADQGVPSKSITRTLLATGNAQAYPVQVILGP